MVTNLGPPNFCKHMHSRQPKQRDYVMEGPFFWFVSRVISFLKSLCHTTRIMQKNALYH